ncbi:MAG: class I SAM-dependent methyltransferase [Candidatus Scalindua sp.]|nr:class I SAM-dependent methyltransferase [Candidatus Scalindua sp.]
MNKKNQYCRSCKQTQLDTFLNLGMTPLADRLLNEELLTRPEPTFPLVVAFCSSCGLVQILETVSREVLFHDDYPYYSSFSPHLLKHSRENVLDLIRTYNLNSDSFVIELASNDGYLLKNYIEYGIKCLGIDPVEALTKASEKVDVPTLCAFFSNDLAEQLREEGRRADIIHANNVLAHVSDTNDFVEGIRNLLKDDGVAVIEVPYVRDLIDHCEFDTIYHEHHCYFSVTALDNLFRRHSLFLNEVRRIQIHGGSLRLYVEHKEKVGESVKSLLNEETAKGVDQFSYYSDFAIKVDDIKKSLHNLLTELKSEGKRIAAYGAAAKGSTLINYVDIGKGLIDFVVDSNTYKHNRYMPGKHIPIYGLEKLLLEMPDFVLLFAWNFADEIMRQHEEYIRKGGKFILPIPQPVIV